jgi:hypothetical protein
MRDQLLADNDLVTIPIRELAATKRTTSLIHADPAGLNPSLKLWIESISAYFAQKKR